MSGIQEELIVFALAVLSGITVRTVYRCISCFRQIVKHNLAAMGVEDLFFWIGTSFYLFMQIYYTSDGSIRWYFVLGLVLGVLVSSVLYKKIEKSQKKIYSKKQRKSVKGLD